MAAQRHFPIRSTVPATGTLTQTATSTSNPEEGEQEESRLPTGTLRLRGAPSVERRGITWAEDVVDNEGLGRKKSKVCCIYHKPRAVGESSDESSDSSSSSGSSDGEPDNSSARRAGGARQRRHHKHDHDDGEGCHNAHEEASSMGSTAVGKSKARRKKSPNAYEKMPGTKTQKNQVP